MKVLVFGMSHVGALRLSFSQQLLDHKLFEGKNINFIAIPGPNFKNVRTSSNSTEVLLPKEIYAYKDGKKKSDKPSAIIAKQTIDLDNYDAVIWVEGPNIISVCQSFFGGQLQHPVLPALLTKNLAEMIFQKILKSRKHYSNLRSNCHNTRFLYIGAPVSFDSHKVNKRLDCDDNSIFKKAISIHRRNVSFLRKECNSLRQREGFVLSPEECVHPSGLFSYDEFARDIKVDHGHASANYGMHLWKEILEFLK